MSTNAATIPVLLFASYADVFGTRRIEAPIAAPCKVADLLAVLRDMPGGSRLPVRPMMAVNQSWAGPDTLIASGDEVALIPPVAGG